MSTTWPAMSVHRDRHRDQWRLHAAIHNERQACGRRRVLRR
jgi:hypothetical protein